jgi:hypothetical protein
MNIKLVVLGFFLFFAGSIGYSAQTYYIPQIAIGSYTDSVNGDGSYKTTFVFFNNSNLDANVTLNLANDDGSALSATIPGLGTNASTFSFALPQGATRIYQTDNSGTARAGVAIVTSDQAIGVSGLYTIFKADGSFVTEVGVASAAPMTSFILPVQITDPSIQTALGLYNPSTTDANITFTLTSTDGTSGGSATYTLPKGKHFGGYVNNSSLFPNVKSFKGTLTVSSSVAIAAMTLRQNASPLSYTSCPVIATPLTQKTFNLAQFVNGSSATEGYKTTFMLFNPSSTAANVTLTLTKDDGTALTATIPDLSASAKSTFTILLGAGKSQFLQTDGTGAEGQGAAVISSDINIGAAGIFTQYDGHGNFATETGVQNSPALTTFTLPIDSVAGVSDTGIALFNPGSTAVTITPNFLDAGGISTPAASPISLPAHGHYANFFGGIFPGMGSVQGSLAVSAPTAISALTMRENLSPFGMTSLPVVEGISTGTTYPTTGSSLLPKAQTGVDASADVTVNKTLPYGYKLSGAVSAGNAFPGSVSARSGSSVYTGSVSLSYTTFNWTYSVIVPPGTYDIYVSTTFAASDNSATTVNYHRPGSVTVTKDTTVDITVPDPTLFTVTGTISGSSSALSFMSSASSVSVQFSAADGLTSGTGTVTNGAYSVALPAGNYSISLFALVGQESVGLNLGTLQVSGNATANLTMGDFATLSGTASFAGAIPDSASIMALDTSNTYSFGSLDVASGFKGPYTMKLAKNHTYNMSISYPVKDAGTTVGNVDFPVAASSISFAGDSTYNFTLPALPTLAIISGKVVDGTSKAVANAAITASSSSLTGTPNTMYSASGKTDSTGSYSIKVLKGTDYQLTFTPPAPSVIPTIPTF